MPNLAQKKPGKRLLESPLLWRAFSLACVLAMVSHFGFGCSGWDPRRPFERHAPDVDRAIDMIEAGQYADAEEALVEYLDSEACKKGKLSLSTRARQKPDASFDLGLVLFYLAESFGQRFGELPPETAAGPSAPGAPPPPPAPADDDAAKKAESRDFDIKCGLIASVAIARDQSVPVELRARAAYLAGNLEFLRHDYKAAIERYEEALRLLPGAPLDAQPDSIARDAGYNRAVALRRLEKQQDAGQDGAQPEPEPDAGPEEDPQDPRGPDANDGGGEGDGDAGQDAGDKDGNDPADAGPDGGEDDGPDAGNGQNPNPNPDPGPQDPAPVPQQPEPSPEPGQPGGPTGEQGDRVLDQFDQLPTYQQEEAKKRGEGRRRSMEDK